MCILKNLNNFPLIVKQKRKCKTIETQLKGCDMDNYNLFL